MLNILCNCLYNNSGKHPVAEDIFLTDHTVSLDDPRLTSALSSRTRIRRLTGFDSSLMRDRVRAVKTDNDISKGLASIEDIERQMRRHEQRGTRRIDAEKANLERRLMRIQGRYSSRSHSLPQVGVNEKQLKMLEVIRSQAKTACGESRSSGDAKIARFLSSLKLELDSERGLQERPNTASEAKTNESEESIPKSIVDDDRSKEQNQFVMRKINFATS